MQILSDIKFEDVKVGGLVRMDDETSVGTIQDKCIRGEEKFYLIGYPDEYCVADNRTSQRVIYLGE